MTKNIIECQCRCVVCGAAVPHYARNPVSGENTPGYEACGGVRACAACWKAGRQDEPARFPGPAAEGPAAEGPAAEGPA